MARRSVPSPSVSEPAQPRHIDSLTEVIVRGNSSWIDVGEALTVVNANRLYRDAGYSKFVDYLRECCAMAKQTGYDHIWGLEVYQKVRCARTFRYLSLAHAVELRQLETDQQIELAGRVEDQHISAHELRQLVSTLRRTARRESEAQAARNGHLLRVVGGPDWLVEQGDAARPRCEPGSLDLQVTSPPYCVGPWDARYDYIDYVNYDDYRDRLMPAWAASMYRAAAPWGRLVVVVAIDVTRPRQREPLAVDWLNALRAAGWNYKEWIHWWEDNISGSVARGTPDPSAPNVISPVEAVMVFYKGDGWNLRPVRLAKPDRWGPRDLTDDEWKLWTLGAWKLTGQKGAEVDDFPAAFPPELIRRLIKLYSYPRGRVGDLFLGTGTTGEVAVELGREFYGAEISTRWVNYARDRVRRASRAAAA